MKRILFFLACLFSINTHAQNKISVVTQHNDTYRTGWNKNETTLTPSNVATSAFGIIGSLAVDDQVYAQPLVIKNVTIGSFTGSAVFAATVNNTLYAFNADDVSYGAPLWQTSLNPQNQRAPNISDLQDATYGAPCGGNYHDFSGRFGIVGTPVIDTLTGTLYVVTKTIEIGGTFHHYIHAIDITTGNEKNGSPKLIDATVDGNGDGSTGGKLKFNSVFHNQRPGLLLHNNIVYVAFASHCDWGPYHGWVLGYDAASLDLKYTYNATPNGWAGGIWMAGEGITLADDGNLYFVTGNGTTGSDNADLNGGRSECLIKMNAQLQLIDWYTPSNFKYLDDYDLDYGCDGALAIPGSSITVSGSKEGLSYVVENNNMGRYTPGNTQVKDTILFNPNNAGDVHVHGSPVYAKLGGEEYVYGWTESFKLRQFTFNRTAGIFSNEFKQGNRNLDYGMPGAMLSVSSNGEDAATGILWASFPTSGNANQQVRPGTLAAYDASDVSKGELWNTDMNATDVVGNFSKFNNPTIANGKVYLATFSNALKVYGLKCDGALTNLTYGNGSGLKAEYFTNSLPSDNFPANATITHLDAQVNFNWGSGSPDVQISNDNFKARWTGKLQPLTSDVYTFYITAGDGVRLYIDNNLVIDSWTDKPITELSATVTMDKTKQYDIKLEYYSAQNAASCILQWSANGICKQNIPAAQLYAATVACNSDGDGLKAAYFSNQQPAAAFPLKATAEIIVPAVNFDWGGGSPDGISNDLFKARFTGFVESLDAGTYTFYVTADDGIRLWVNNQLLIDKWIDQAPTEYSATINLAACAKYPIRIEYYENGGGAVCKLEWSGPTVARQAIPTSQLYTQSGSNVSTNSVLAYPNPAKSKISIVINTAFTTGDEIAMFSADGKLVKHVTVSSSIQGSTVTIPVIDLAPGVYFIRIVAGNKTYKAKVLLIH